LTASQYDTFLQGGVVSISLNPHARGSPIFGYPTLLIQYIRTYPPYWRPFLHPQPEDTQCRGDRDPGVDRVWWGSPREGYHLGDPGVDGRIILRWIFRKWDVGVWNGWS